MSESALQQIVCCLGQPVAGNPTQYMVEKAFVAAGLDWRYLTLEVPPSRLGDAIRGIRALGFRGANLTIPHKVAAIEFLDSLSESAQLMGAVNCVHRAGDLLVGENTDGKAFVQSLRERIDPKGKKVLILGAGGAARAIAVELGLAGATDITVVNRSSDRGIDLARLLEQRVHVASRWLPWEGNFPIPPETEIVVHATSIGLGDQEAIVPIVESSLEPSMIVADVIFNPPATRLLRIAADRGCRTVDGLGMLVNQGVINFRIWTGLEPDARVMREAIEEYLEV